MHQSDPTQRQPKGDHNRRLAMGLDPDQFAAEAGVTTEELREYERTSPDHRFDPAVAARVGAALERLEAKLPNFETARRDPAPGFSRDDVGRGAPADGPPTTGPSGVRYTAEDET